LHLITSKFLDSKITATQTAINVKVVSATRFPLPRAAF
jgi:hypothetical protein